MSTTTNRRGFLRGSAAVFAGFGVFGLEGCSRLRPRRRRVSPNEKLNIGVIGVGGRGSEDIEGVKGENIVALCDVDSDELAAALAKFPSAKTYADFRFMLDQKDLDAVVVATPDHTHAAAAAAALKRGLPVYCEKPLTHSVTEARYIAYLADKTGLATQMGTQIHAGSNYRRVVELVQSGAIGPVGEVHVWVDKTWSGGERPSDTPPVPKNLNWDLWLGPAPERPYHPLYAPKNWRRWWDFGGGTLADMGCHYTDLPFWALGLKDPKSVEAKGPEVHPESTPPKLTVRYEFDSSRGGGPVSLTWYDDGLKPPALAEHGLPKWGSGVLFIGTNGRMLLADYDRHLLFPQKDFKDFVPPAPSIPDSIGHHAEWIRACKTGEPTTCNFEYGGRLTEAILLGNVAFRSGGRIEWDAEHMICPGNEKASMLLERAYRKGWSL